MTHMRPSVHISSRHYGYLSLLILFPPLNTSADCQRQAAAGLFDAASLRWEVLDDRIGCCYCLSVRRRVNALLLRCASSRRPRNFIRRRGGNLRHAPPAPCSVHLPTNGLVVVIMKSLARLVYTTMHPGSSVSDGAEFQHNVSIGNLAGSLCGVRCQARVRRHKSKIII